MALPAAAVRPWRDGQASPGVEFWRLGSTAPFEEFARKWRRRGLPEPVRIVARARAGWWPSGTEMPDGWRAWIELPDGAAVVVERAAGQAAAEAGVALESRAARALAEALSAAGRAGA